MTTTTTARPTLTVLKAGRLFDGTTDTLLPHPRVLLDENGTIRAVGQSDIDLPGATVVDLDGSTLLPGLIDTHIHLAFDAGLDPVGRLAARDDAEVMVAMAAAARRAARGGVTTVRDLGDRGYLSLALRAAAGSDPTIPDIVAAGPPITTPGGHCHYLGCEAGTADEMRSAVREHVARGVDVIKIMASGGNLTPGSRPEVPQYDPAVLGVAVQEAHRAGLPITAHAHGTAAVAEALVAGVDQLEHVSFMTADGVDPAPPALVAQMVERQVNLGLTVGFVPADGPPPPNPMLARLPALMANLRLLCEAGATITAGTDGGIGPGKPHDAVRWAVANLVAVGMSPAQALRACTSRAAAACGLQDRKGRLAVGYDADILAVEGNPLQDPAALHRITAVYVRGTRLEPGPTR